MTTVSSGTTVPGGKTDPADSAFVQENTADPHERSRPDSRTMNHGSVPNTNVIPDFQRLAVGRVEDGSVLHVDAMSDSNRRYIAANHDVVHNRHLVSEHDVAPDVGRRRHENVLAEPGHRHSIAHGRPFYEAYDENATGLTCSAPERSIGCILCSKTGNI